MRARAVEGEKGPSLSLILHTTTSHYHLLPRQKSLSYMRACLEATTKTGVILLLYARCCCTERGGGGSTCTTTALTLPDFRGVRAPSPRVVHNVDTEEPDLTSRRLLLLLLLLPLLLRRDPEIWERETLTKTDCKYVPRTVYSESLPRKVLTQCPLLLFSHSTTTYI